MVIVLLMYLTTIFMAIPKYDLLLPIFCDQVASIYIGMWAYEIFWIKHCKNRSNSPNSENFMSFTWKNVSVNQTITVTYLQCLSCTCLSEIFSGT